MRGVFNHALRRDKKASVAFFFLFVCKENRDRCVKTNIEICKNYNAKHCGNQKCLSKRGILSEQWRGIEVGISCLGRVLDDDKAEVFGRAEH